MSTRTTASRVTVLVLLLGTALLAVAVLRGASIEYRLAPNRIIPAPDGTYATPLPFPWPLVVAADDFPTAKAPGSTELFEDGRPLGNWRIAPVDIRSDVDGRITYWRAAVYFSSSDGSDPRANGKQYSTLLRVRLAEEVLLAAILSLGLVAGYVLVLRRSRAALDSGLIDPADLATPACLWAGVALGFIIVIRTEGTAFWLILGLDALLLIWAAATTRRAYVKGIGRPWHGFRWAPNATLLVVSSCLALMAAEAYLEAREGDAVERAASAESTDAGVANLEQALGSFGVTISPDVLRGAVRRLALKTLPPELGSAPAFVEGAAMAHRWHGVLHVGDDNGMRRATPFPAKRENVFRVMVVGDSLTYGQGIDEQWTYPRQLEALLEGDYHVEILNLGVMGYQSEDVLGVVRSFLPELQPDLVVYGVCLNDFLPSRVGEYRSDDAYAIPLPESVKAFFTGKSRLAGLAETAYNQMLLETGLRVDFFNDILRDLKNYQTRFSRDVATLNQLVTDLGLPPAVALTLSQTPAADTRAHRISLAAESHLEAAGMDVIEMSPYYHHFSGQDFRVSRFEGHPNEVANAIWAFLLEQNLRGRSELRTFRKSGS